MIKSSFRYKFYIDGVMDRKQQRIPMNITTIQNDAANKLKLPLFFEQKKKENSKVRTSQWFPQKMLDDLLLSFMYGIFFFFLTMYENVSSRFINH